MWARAIESCLKSLVHAFCVHDHHDEKELESIFAAVVPPGRKPPTITNQFAVRLEDRIESLHYSRPMLGAGCSLGVEPFQVFMGTGLWGCGTVGQTSRCFIVCSSPHSHVVCPSLLNPHFCIRAIPCNYGHDTKKLIFLC